MSFLRRLLRTCAGFFRGDPSPAPVHDLAPTHLLARFLTSKNHFSTERNEVKAAAFLPPPDLKLSVFDIMHLSEQQIWAIGKKHVCEPRGKTLYGRGQFPVSTAVGVGLRVEVDNDPPRHASLYGWPPEKSEQKVVALQLAKRAELKRVPTG